MTRAIASLLLQTPYSIPGQYVWDLLLITCLWCSFMSEYFGLPCQHHCTSASYSFILLSPKLYNCTNDNVDIQVTIKTSLGDPTAEVGRSFRKPGMYNGVRIFVISLDRQYRHQLLYSLSTYNPFCYPKIFEILAMKLKIFKTYESVFLMGGKTIFTECSKGCLIPNSRTAISIV